MDLHQAAGEASAEFRQLEQNSSLFTYHLNIALKRNLENDSYYFKRKINRFENDQNKVEIRSVHIRTKEKFVKNSNF